MKNKECKIVERKKLFFILPICLIAVAIIMGIIFGLTAGSAMNLGNEFVGGYTINVRPNEFITQNNYEYYEKQITDLADDYSFTYLGEDYGINLGKISFKDGKETKDTVITIEYKADKSINIFDRDKMMDELNKNLTEEITNIVRYQRPTKAEISGSSATITYDTNIYSEVMGGDYAKQLEQNGFTISNPTFADSSNKKVQFTVTSGALTEDAILAAAAIDRFYSVDVAVVEATGGTLFLGLMSTMIYACLAILLAVLIYAFIRYDLASGFAIILSLFVDIIIVLSLTTIFHVEITSGILAAIVATMILSLIGKVSLFDKIKEIRKSLSSSGVDATATEVANSAIKQSCCRSRVIAISLAIFIVSAIVVAAIGGVWLIAAISLQILFGLIAAAFTTVCLVPAVWVVFKQNRLGKYKQFSFNPTKKDTISTKKDANDAPIQADDANN